MGASARPFDATGRAGVADCKKVTEKNEKVVARAGSGERERRGWAEKTRKTERRGAVGKPKGTSDEPAIAWWGKKRNDSASRKGRNVEGSAKKEKIRGRNSDRSDGPHGDGAGKR